MIPDVGRAEQRMKRTNVLLSLRFMKLNACSVTNCMYIGQTVRTIKSRIREHMTVHSSAFFQHVINSHQVMPEDCCKWKILATERDNAARLALEALFIRRRSDILVNGCSGQSLLPFLDRVTSSSSETHALPY